MIKHLQRFVKVQTMKRERNYLAYWDQWRKAESNEVEQKGNIINWRVGKVSFRWEPVGCVYPQTQLCEWTFGRVWNKKKLKEEVEVRRRKGKKKEN